MMKRTMAGIAVAMLGIMPLSAAAFELDQIKINGFLSQGYLKSKDNNFLTYDTNEGSAEFNEAGLTVTTQLSDQLRLGVQFLSRDLGPEGNNEVSLDWAIADYHLHDALGVRVGKVKLPIGLFNEGRDSDFLRTTIFLPQSTYDETKRAMLGAINGGGIYGNLPAGVIGDFDYQFVYGETSFPSDSVILVTLQQGATGALKTLNPTATNVQVNKVSADNDYVYAGSLTYNTPLDGLRLGGTYFEAKTSLTLNGRASIPTSYTDSIGNTVMIPTEAPRNGTGEVGMKDGIVASLDYTSAWFDLTGEYTEYKNIKKFYGQNLSHGTAQGYYGLLTVHATTRLHPFVMYDVLYANKDDKDGKAYADKPAPGIQSQDFMGWRKDLAVGVRFDITPNWLIKAEWHDLNGVGPNALAFTAAEDLKEDWNYFAVKTTVNF